MKEKIFHFQICNNSKCRAHLYPAKIFISVDFPAPEGPMIPISSLLLNLPDRHFRRAL